MFNDLVDRGLIKPRGYTLQTIEDSMKPDTFNVSALLADLMGHESFETTRIYLRRTASEQQEIVDKYVTW